MNITDAQVNDLAASLAGIITEFYKDPRHEEEYQKWLLNVEEQRE